MDYDETKLPGSLPDNSTTTNTEKGSGMSIGTKLQIEKLENKLERKQRTIEELEKKYIYNKHVTKSMIVS